MVHVVFKGGGALGFPEGVGGLTPLVLGNRLGWRRNSVVEGSLLRAGPGFVPTTSPHCPQPTSTFCYSSLSICHSEGKNQF